MKDEEDGDRVKEEMETRLPSAFQCTQWRVATALMLKPLAILVKIVV